MHLHVTGTLTNQPTNKQRLICSALTIVRAATPRQKLQINLATSPCHSKLTPGQPVPSGPITPGAWQDSHWSANASVTRTTRPGKKPHRENEDGTQVCCSPGRTPYHQANRAVSGRDCMCLRSHGYGTASLAWGFRRPPREWKIPGFESRLRRDFFGVESYQ